MSTAAPAHVDLISIEPLPDNPRQGRMTLNFHPGQLQAWNSPRRFVFIISGTQGGKTSFGPHWLYREIKERGPGDYLAVTATYPLLKLKMLPEFLRHFRDRMKLGEWAAADRVFEFSEAGQRRAFGSVQSEPTRVIFGSAANPESLESATAKGAWLDECGQDQFGIEAWDAIIRRLSIYRGRVLGTTTPYNLGWVKQQLHDRWRAGDTDIEIVQFDSIANPRFPVEEYERARATMPDWKFRMFYRGQFERPPGLIYNDFIDAYREDGGHKVAPFDIPPEWPRYVGLDFGAVNTALVWIAFDPRARVGYVYRASLDGGKSTREHADAALAVAAGTNVVRWMGGAKSETQQRMDWNAAGVKVREPEVYDVEAGIDRVIALWRTFQLYVFDTVTGLLDELGSYARELDDRNEPTEKIKHKERYHRCFIAGTQIVTDDGAIPIEMVKPGALVLTREGWMPVVDAGLTTEHALVWTVVLSNGNTLTGTKDHPVYVIGRGYTSLNALRYGDTLLSGGSIQWMQSGLCHHQVSCVKSCAMAVSTTTDTQTVTTMPTVHISAPSVNAKHSESRFISRCGSMPTALSLTIGRFITRTAIHRTTRWITSLRLVQRIMRAPMRKCERLNRPMRYEHMHSASENWQAYGTHRKWAGNGIDSKQNRHGKGDQHGISFVSIAEMPSNPESCTAFGSVLSTARLRPAAAQVSTMNRGSAGNVVTHSRLTDTAAAFTAGPTVLSVHPAGRAPVYNLTVAGASEYVANGVLVHNCDALRYIAPVIGKMRGADPLSGFNDQQDAQARERAERIKHADGATTHMGAARGMVF